MLICTGIQGRANVSQQFSSLKNLTTQLKVSIVSFVYTLSSRVLGHHEELEQLILNLKKFTFSLSIGHEWWFWCGMKMWITNTFCFIECLRMISFYRMKKLVWNRMRCGEKNIEEKAQRRRGKVGMARERVERQSEHDPIKQKKWDLRICLMYWKTERWKKNCITFDWSVYVAKR